MNDIDKPTSSRKKTKKPLMRRIGGKIISPFVILYYVLKSSGVSFADKAKICGSLIYIVFPFDFIPDFIPFAGYGDDLATLLWAIHTVKSNITPEIKSSVDTRIDTLLG